MTMNNKTAIITGGAGAVGKAIAKRFAKEGARVVVADLNLSGAECAAEEIRADGGEAIAVQLDAADEAQVEQVAKKVVDEYGSIDILVNSAGEFKEMPMMDINVEYWERMMRNNLRTTFISTKVIGEIMTKQGKGNVINVGSTAAERGRAGQVAYCAAKGGVKTFTMSAAIQLSPLGVNVNAIAPGVLDTLNRERLFKDSELETYTRNRMPITKWGSPEDVANVAVFLASEEAAYITGQTITVDGGLTARLATCGEDR